MHLINVRNTKSNHRLRDQTDKSVKMPDTCQLCTNPRQKVKDKSKTAKDKQTAVSYFIPSSLRIIVRFSPLDRVDSDGSSDWRGRTQANQHLISFWRVQSVRKLNDVGVVARQIRALPDSLNSWQNRALVMNKAQIWLDIEVGAGGSAAEDTAVALVPEIILEGIFSDFWIPLANHVLGLIADELPHVGAHVPPSEVVESPVGFHGGDLAVVVIVVVIGGSDELLVNG